MKRILLALGLWLSASNVFAQTTFTMPPPAGVFLGGLQVVASCGAASLTANQLAYGVMDTSGKFCVNATVSASITFPTIGAAVPSTADFVGINVAGTLRGWSGLSTGSIFPGAVAVVDASGNQVTSFGGANASVGVTGIAAPASATYIGITSGGNLTGWTGAVTNAGTFATQVNGFTSWAGSNLGAMANYGTSPGAVLVPGVNAYVTGATGLAIGSTTSGQTGSLVMGSSTTYAPTTTTADTWPLSMDAVGNLRVVPQASGSKVTGTASQTTGGTTTSLITAVTSERIYVQAFSCDNTGASASLISFQDGSGGTTLWTTIVPAGGGSNLASSAPMFWTTAGNALFFAPATSSTTVHCNASGYAGN